MTNFKLFSLENLAANSQQKWQRITFIIRCTAVSNASLHYSVNISIHKLYS